MMKVIVAYIPVIHRGYLEMLTRHADADELCILSEGLTTRFPYLAKEVRALSSHQCALAIESFGIIPRVRVVGEIDLAELAAQAEVIVMPDEDVSHQIAEQFFERHEVIFSAVFLRWDKRNTVTERVVRPQRVLTTHATSVELLGIAGEYSQRSSDWWRQVGAVIVNPQGMILLVGCNHHLPTPFTPYIDGDPRNAHYKGVHIELTTAIHAEASLIATAARRGIRLHGTSIYVTTFPCPVCAKLIGEAGIACLYYKEGYAMLDGESVLKQFGVEIVHVQD